MSASTSIVSQYEEALGYKPESLQKLVNWAQEKHPDLKYSQVKRAFEAMKKDMRVAPSRDVVKSEATNMDVNASVIEVDLVPTPDADGDNDGDDDHKTNENAVNKSFTFDISKALECMGYFQKFHKDVRITAETLPQILAWCNSEENAMGVTLSELKAAYGQKRQLEDEKKKKRRQPPTKNTKNKKGKTPKKDALQEAKLDLLQTQSMVEFCDDVVMKELLQMYVTKWEHEPLDGRQLLNFMEEQAIADTNAQFKAVNFETLSAFFSKYEKYVQSVKVQNLEIEHKLSEKEKRKSLSQFNCRDVLNKYIADHGEPKDVIMFYKYVLELGYDLEFTELDEAYHTAKGIKKTKPKKVKVKNGSKSVMAKYKKAVK